MPRNLTENHYANADIYVNGERTVFGFKKPHQAHAMGGMLVPLGDPIPAFPGNRFDLFADLGIRTDTMVVPPLDPIYVDVFAVWVPHRVVWTHMAQFLGENDTTAWTQALTLTYPYITFGDLTSGIYNLFGNNAISDVDLGNLFLSVHYGLFDSDYDSTKPNASLKINVLAFRGYYAIWNYLFRDENYQRPVLFSKGDTGTAGEFGYFLKNYSCKTSGGILQNDLIDADIGDGMLYGNACLMSLNKYHNFSTAVLPQPQFGDAVELAFADTAPIIASGNQLHLMGDLYLGTDVNTKLPVGAALGINSQTAGYLSMSPDSFSGTVGVHASNLVADLTKATALTINQFRIQVMEQRYLEALARGGRRVPEYYRAIYGVHNTAAVKDYPVLLRRNRYALGVNQVVATADSSDSGWTTHLGDTGAYSYTVLRNVPLCDETFTEFGYIHILYGFRSPDRFSQVIQPHFLKSELLDEYNPFFDHIGDVAVNNLIVNMDAKTAGNFGYQEAWWDERTQIGMAVGALNKKYGSLKFWTIGEVFADTLTTCTPSYLVFDPAVYNDVFVHSYEAYPQFIIDALIHGTKAARMSAHSIPGIVGRI